MLGCFGEVRNLRGSLEWYSQSRLRCERVALNYRSCFFVNWTSLPFQPYLTFWFMWPCLCQDQARPIFKKLICHSSMLHLWEVLLHHYSTSPMPAAILAVSLNTHRLIFCFWSGPYLLGSSTGIRYWSAPIHMLYYPSPRNNWKPWSFLHDVCGWPTTLCQ